MGHKRFIRVLSLAGLVFVLGAGGGWWFWYAGERVPQNLQTTAAQLQADGRHTEVANTQLQTENHQLKQGNAVLQASLAELSGRVAALEDTKTTLKTAGPDTDVVDLTGRVTALEHTKTTLEAGMRHTEVVNAQLQTENQQLQQDSVSLQAGVVDLQGRITALEHTKTSLEGTVESMRKQLDGSISKRDYRRVVSEKNRLVKRNVALRENKSKLENKITPVSARPASSATVPSLAHDELALLLVKFLATYAQHTPGWFNAPSIQSVGGKQEEFVLFQYHSWITIEAKLRSMEHVDRRRSLVCAGVFTGSRQCDRSGL